MKRTKTPPEQPGLFKELERLKAQEEEAREAKIAFLKAELQKARQAVRALEKELRLAGASREELGGGRINWDEVFEQLGTTFTAKEIREVTGAAANLVASIIFKWKEQGRISGVGRGEYRKLRLKSVKSGHEISRP